MKPYSAATLLLVAALLTMRCGGTPPPPVPSPPPTPMPSATPTPAPTPTPKPPPIPPLSAVGSKWSTELIGIASCCESNGWPQITDSLLVKWAGAGGNLIHIRLGPFWNIAEGGQFNGYETSGTKADLTRFRGGYWNALQALAIRARDLKVYIEVDVIDGWPMRGANQKTSPWLAANNIQGEDVIGCEQLQGKLKSRHDAWVRKVVQMLGPYPNVIWQVGNENGVCSPPVTSAWESDLIRIVRDEEPKHGFIKHMIGTNAEIGDIEALASVDYVSLHQDLAAAVHKGKPTGVNEYPKITPNDYAVQLRAARSMGTRFDLWMGSMNDADLEQCLKVVRDYKAGK